MLSRFAIAACVAAVTTGCSDRFPTQPSPISVPVQLSAARHADGETHGFLTHLSGDEEVPVRDTEAQGQALFQFNDVGGLDYTLLVANIENVTQAHIHCGAFGSNGPITVWLYPSAPPSMLIPGRSQGTLAEGTITGANVMPVVGNPACPGDITSFDDLIAKLQTGGAYVNVHTTQLPGGEIRGQID